MDKKTREITMQRTKQEQFIYTNYIANKKDEPTKIKKADGTLEAADPDNEGNNPIITRKYFLGRLIYYIKTNWQQCVFAIICAMAVFFFFTMNVRLAVTGNDISHLNKDISRLDSKIDENSKKTEKIADEVNLIRADLKSLNDRFAMFIELFRNNGVNP
jgi:hypothetical protein